MAKSFTLELSKPIDAGDKKITELVINEPTGGHLMKHGIPVDGQGNIKMDVVGNLLEASTGIQRPFLNALGVGDFMKAFKALMSFINVDEEEALGN